MQPSSDDLHPSTGARFVFDREPGEPPRYRVAIHLPGTATWSGQLSWSAAQAELVADPEAAQAVAEVDAETLAWAQAEAGKLARVLHRDPRDHMVRWRGPA